jgi:hypothetical protein
MPKSEAEPRSPWLDVRPEECDGHMHAVEQDAALARLFRQAYDRVRPRKLAVLGCGTGYGMECIDPGLTPETIALDLNPEFLAVARRNLPHLQGHVRWVAGSVEQYRLRGGGFEMVHAALLLEYVELDAFVSCIAGGLSSTGVVSVVIQLPGGPKGSDFPSIQTIADVARLVPPGDLVEQMAGLGLRPLVGEEVALPLGKRFLSLVFASQDSPL